MLVKKLLYIYSSKDARIKYTYKGKVQSFLDTKMLQIISSNGYNWVSKTRY